MGISAKKRTGGGRLEWSRGGSGFAVCMLVYVLGMMLRMDDKKLFFSFFLSFFLSFFHLFCLFHALLRFTALLFSHDIWRRHKSEYESSAAWVRRGKNGEGRS